MSAPEVMILTEGSFSEEFRGVVQVMRRTKTQIVVIAGNRERRFNAITLKEIGGSGYHVPHLDHATPSLIAEVREENKRRRLVARLRAVSWKALPTNVLEAVVAALPEGTP